MKNATLLLCVVVLVSACDSNPFVPQSGSSSRPTARATPEQDRVVVDDFENLKEGAQTSWRLQPGLYKAEVTASDGAGVQWVGENCPGVRESKTFSGFCEFHNEGQLVVSNPTTFGLGADSSVTVKITKLARGTQAEH